MTPTGSTRRCSESACKLGIGTQLSARLEQCDWAALAAPKPVQFQHGRTDAATCPGADAKLLNLEWNIGVMPAEECETMFREVERAWALAGGKGRVETHFHPEGHRVANEAAFAWLASWLPAGSGAGP